MTHITAYELLRYHFERLWRIRYEAAARQSLRDNIAGQRKLRRHV
jgi:hypothetical protein